MVNQWSRVVVVVTTCQTIGEVVTSWGPGDGGENCDGGDGENCDGDGGNSDGGDGENSDGGDGENGDGGDGENCDGDGDNGYGDKLLPIMPIVM